LSSFTAKEASKRIVYDLLARAGGEDLTDDQFGFEEETQGYAHNIEAHSPTVVRQAARLEDDTF
jgi:hypothetical protein